MSKRQPDSRHKPAWLAAIVLVGTLVWAGSLDGVFLYDDFDAVRDNVHLSRLWPPSEPMSLPMIHTGDTVSGRPILSLSFAVNRALLGPDARGYHIGNVAIHLLAACLLFALIEHTARTYRATAFPAPLAAALAGCVSLLWAVHPLQTNSVTYIAQRAEALTGLWLLATLYCAARGLRSDRSARWFAASVLCAALGMGSKEVMAGAPLLVLIYDRTFERTTIRRAFALRPALYSGLAATWLVLLLPLSIPLFDPDPRHNDFTGRSPFAYALTQPEVLLHYLRLVVWPRPLILSYEWPLVESVGAAAAPATVILALLGLAVRAVIVRHWTAVPAAAFFLVLGPSSSFAALTQRCMEHRMYLPLAAVLILVGAAALAGARRQGPFALRLLAVVTGVAVTSAALATHARNLDYHDEIAFWEKNVEQRPDNYVAITQLARAHFRRDNFDAAKPLFERVVQLEPGFATAHNWLGRILVAERDFDGARRTLDEAVRLDPGLAVAHNNLGVLAEHEGRLDDAAGHYRDAIALAPLLAVAHTNLGGVLEASGDLEAAESTLKRATELDTESARPHIAYGLLLARSGNTDDARVALQRAVEIDPTSAVAHSNLGALLAAGGDLEAAEKHFELTVELDPDFPRGHFNLGLLRRDQGDFERALAAFERELARAPDFEAARREAAALRSRTQTQAGSSRP